MTQRRVIQLAIFILIACGSAMAQVGKISGTVKDKQTNEPLVGASVLVVGTTLGAATGADGRYTILNIPPGTYDLRATFVGYQEVVLQNVRVTTGLIETANFDLAQTAVEVAPVTIIGQRPLIEKSATNAIRIVTAEDIQNLPIRGPEGVVALQPGVVVVNDQVFIRGSRPSEVGFIVEGANTRNILGGVVTPGAEGGENFISTIPEAVEEVLVQAGGYNAEFGGANAGLISQNLKTGRDRYTASIQVETDNFVDPGEQFLDTYSYGYSDYVLTLSGPTISDRVRLFIAGQNRFQRDITPSFWEGGDFGFLADNGSRGGDSGEVANVRWLPGNIPGNSLNQYSLNTTALLDYSPLRIKASALGSWQRSRVNTIARDLTLPQLTSLRHIFDLDRVPQVDQSSWLLSARGTYFFTPTLFSELTLSFLDTRMKQYDPNFEDNLLAYGDSIEGAARGWQYSSYSDPPRPYDFFGFPFNRPGFPLSGFLKRQNNYISAKLDVTAQIGRHELKTGGAYEYWTVRNYGGFSNVELPQLLTAIRSRPDEARDPTGLARIIRRETFLDNYGYDEFGRKLDSGPDGPKNPAFFSFFVQDRVEYSDLIINGGLRFDFLDMDTWNVANPNDPGFDAEEFTIRADRILEGRTFSFVQPRLGFSFPVTDRTVFHLQYGRFVQPPPLYTVYRGRAAAGLIYIGQFYITNPVAYDIEPTRTTQYEVGFTQQFADFASFDITGFYKDIKGQLQYNLFLVDRQIATVQNYPVYDNSDFATTKGLEFRLNVRRINRVQALLNYTLSDARGTNSFPGSAAAAINVAGVRPTAITPLLFSQTHRGSINLDYRFGPNEGGPILRQLGVNLLFEFNSGRRFTRSGGGGGQQGPETGALLNEQDARTRTPLEPVNNSVTPWNFTLNLRVDKTFPIAGVNVNLYSYVTNLLNTKNVLNVYDRTGNAFDDGFLTQPGLSEGVVRNLGQRYVALYRAINLENRQHQWQLNGVDLFSSPRQIRFGARVEL